MADPAANSEQSSTPRVVGRPFPPGVSGNPNGRPKGLALAARRLLNEAAETLEYRDAQGRAEGAQVLVRFWINVVADANRDMKLRLQAARELADRGYGRAPQFTPMEDDDPLGLDDEQLKQAVNEFAATMDKLRLVPPLPEQHGDPAKNGG